MDYVFAHELTHRMDILQYKSWKKEKFLKAIDTCRQKVYDNHDTIQKWFIDDGKYKKSFALSDIMDTLSEGKIRTRLHHEEAYWEEDANHAPMEIFADLSSIDILGLDEKEDVISDLIVAYEEIIKSE